MVSPNGLPRRANRQGWKRYAFLVRKDLYDSTANVFCKTLRELAALFIDESAEARLLTSQYESAGSSVVFTVMQNALATCLGLAGRVWLHLFVFYSTWPYKLLALVGPSGGNERGALAREFCTAPLCCLDRDFSQKAQDWKGGLRSRSRSVCVPPSRPRAWPGSRSARPGSHCTRRGAPLWRQAHLLVDVPGPFVERGVRACSEDSWHA